MRFPQLVGMGFVERQLKTYGGVELPKPLVDQLNLANLIWTPINYSSGLPQVFLGYDEKGIEHPSVNDAVATIEIARRVSRIEAEENWLHREKRVAVAKEYEPLFVRIGGIYNGERAVGLKYDAQTGKLLELNASISHDEEPRSGDLNAQSVFCSELTRDLAYSPKDYYERAALITEQMRSQVGSWSLPHSHLLICPLTDSEIQFGKPRNPRAYTDTAKLNRRWAEELGFYARQENGTAIVGFSGTNGEKPWEISVPLQLPKAA